MSEQDNINIVQKGFDGFNNHNADATVQYLADNVRSELPGAPDVLSKDKVREYNRAYIDAFPDLHFDIKDIVAQGDKVAVAWEAKGTHKAPLQTQMGGAIPATNKVVRITGGNLFELRGGLIVRQHAYFDLLSMMTQLGVITPEELMAHMRH
jgi:steroid delta-isomerase-like uncharacterized protein